MTARHATWLFRGAAIYGLILLLPMYFLEKTVAAPDPAFAHPEYYYGFVGAAVAWQLVYWVIGGDPLRYRAFMPLGVVAKLGFWIPTAFLWLNGRTPTSTFMLTNGDLILGIAFFLAWRSLKTPA
ncbi:hypothetical protein FPZ24_16525 [Sphingomonas panacisoli]|uniref:Uncharacterized protein n=1 Tax=Sphingomonas panacisoli TaxID=1813879 RepID=A0A5B8LP44_9SPHN|nr:hypothetical protein [Sphingomonas panacisoli]QDZ08880.1 hypothetical protein FPZ24_16525 [Sphingomonas panacisoli]